MHRVSNRIRLPLKGRPQTLYTYTQYIIIYLTYILSQLIIFTVTECFFLASLKSYIVHFIREALAF